MEVEEIRQLFEAAALVGKRVRFAYLPEETEATPVRVTGARSGMVRLEGWRGEFDPHLLVVVEEPVVDGAEKNIASEPPHLLVVNR